MNLYRRWASRLQAKVGEAVTQSIDNTVQYSTGLSMLSQNIGPAVAGSAGSAPPPLISHRLTLHHVDFPHAVNLVGAFWSKL